MRVHPISYRGEIERFLKEDIGPGDITTLSLSFPRGRAAMKFVAKEPLVVAGTPFVKDVFSLLDDAARVEVLVDEGSRVDAGAALVRVEASVQALLMGERVALNLLQRLSGIATLTRGMVEKIEGTGAVLVDTRKTTPGLRLFEKYAVRVGGARNHRLGLFDAVMVKDNHIRAVGSIKEAVRQVKANAPYTARVEVEVSSLDELAEALDAGADIVLLDNMDVGTLKRAVAMARGRALTEASGGINPDNIREVAETGVDFISTGFVVHHAVWKDISAEMLP